MSSADQPGIIASVASFLHGIVKSALAATCGIAALLGCSAATYHLVEAPMQRLGRWIAAQLDARFGWDKPAGHAAPAPAIG